MISFSWHSKWRSFLPTFLPSFLAFIDIWLSHFIGEIFWLYLSIYLSIFLSIYRLSLEIVMILAEIRSRQSSFYQYEHQFGQQHLHQYEHYWQYSEFIQIILTNYSISCRWTNIRHITASLLCRMSLESLEMPNNHEEKDCLNYGNPLKELKYLYQSIKMKEIKFIEVLIH